MSREALRAAPRRPRSGHAGWRAPRGGPATSALAARLLPREAAGGRAFALALLLLGAACARIAPPQGGAEDREPPKIVSLAPDSGAVSVAIDSPLEIRFSERMNRSSVQDGLRIAPWPGRIEFAWKETTLSCRPVEGWREGTSTTVLLGAPAVDRRRNALVPRQFAFSTGDSLEKGRIEGLLITRSLEKKAVPVYLFGWPAELEPPVPAEAALRPDVLEALRVAETDVEGKFALSFVPVGGRFLAGALFDRDKNRVYDDGADLWGFGETPIVVPDTGSATARAELYLVYADEEGDLAGEIADSLCAGFIAPARVRAQIDSLRGILSGERDPTGFVRAKSDTTPPVTLRAAERESLTVNVDRLAARLPLAVTDSARCGTPIWVSAASTADSSVSADVRTTGAFLIEGLPPGLYRVEAFRDMSGDARRQPDEPYGRLAEPVALKPGHVRDGIVVPILSAPPEGAEAGTGAPVDSAAGGP